jgi:hypothetical protein
VFITGIDPGKDGGLTEIEVGQRGAHVSRVLRMPWQDIGKTHEVLNLRAVRDFFEAGLAGPALVVIEELTYIPAHARARGILDFMREYGKLLGYLELHHRYHTVRPADWQARVIGKIDHPPLPKPAEKDRPTKEERRARDRALRERTARTKAAVKAAVLRFYPDEKAFIPPGCKVPQEGLLDAAALAHYGWTYVLNSVTLAAADGPVPGGARS